MISSSSTKTNVLATLGILFTLGGAARLLPNTLAAADSQTDKVEAEAKSTEEKKDGLYENDKPYPTSSADAEFVALNDAVCLTEEVAAQFTADREHVTQEKNALKQERLELKAWEVELEALAADLNGLRDTLDAKWQEMKAVSDEDLEHLAKMYGSMKPNQAAQIFNQMDSGFAAGFLRMINTDQAGLILASMDAEKAYVVSIEMANRSADIRDAR